MAKRTDSNNAHRYAIIIAFTLSGAAALIYEVTWIKPIMFVFQSSTYVLTMILAAFMLGLAVGARIASVFTDRMRAPESWYARIELLIALYGILLIGLFGRLPGAFVEAQSSASLFGYFTTQFLTVFLLLLIPTALMGATFPIISKLYISKSIGAGIGELYAVNNIGAIIGSVAAGLYLVPVFGISTTIAVAAGLNIAAAVIVLYQFKRFLENVFTIVLVAAAFLIFGSACGSYDITRLYSGVCASGQHSLVGSDVVFYTEGYYGTVGVLREKTEDDIYRLVFNGQGSSGLRMNDVRVSSLLGYMPLLVKPDAERAMVVGFGTGATSNILSRHMPTDTVEIEPKILETASYFAPINEGVLENPNHTLIIDDARHFLAATDTEYDVIVNHPLEPFQSFSSLLFTQEFFAIVSDSLSEDGVYVHWLPTYHLTESEFKSVLNTLSQEFPYYTALVNIVEGEEITYQIYDNQKMVPTVTASENSDEVIIIASKMPIDMSSSTLSANYETLSDYDIAYLTMTSLTSSESIENLIIFDESTYLNELSDSVLITDDKPAIEFSTALNRARAFEEVSF